jgi:hypothetical protein
LGEREFEFHRKILYREARRMAKRNQ